jgi:hypothetical protein
MCACVGGLMAVGCVPRGAGPCCDTAGPASAVRKAEGPAKLTIRWQRLTDDKGETCKRCGLTEVAVDDAAGRLAAAMKPLGIEVEVVKKRMTLADFKDNVQESNRLWINDRPIEEILGATSGTSPCTGCCGDAQCRTVRVGGKTYEDIPSELISRAGLLVAAELVTAAPTSVARAPGDGPPAKPCCAAGTPATGSGKCCG